MEALRDELHPLVEANVGLAWAIALRWKRSGLDIEDLAQAGAIGLVKAARSFDPERGSFSTHATWWIRSEIRRAAEKLTKHQGIDEILDDPPSGRPGADEELAGREAMDRVWEEVGRLPAGDRAVILARYRDGLSPTQAAERFKVTRMRIYQREHRGLDKLRELLAAAI